MERHEGVELPQGTHGTHGDASELGGGERADATDARTAGEAQARVDAESAAQVGPGDEGTRAAERPRLLPDAAATLSPVVERVADAETTPREAIAPSPRDGLLAPRFAPGQTFARLRATLRANTRAGWRRRSAALAAVAVALTSLLLLANTVPWGAALTAMRLVAYGATPTARPSPTATLTPSPTATTPPTLGPEPTTVISSGQPFAPPIPGSTDLGCASAPAAGPYVISGGAVAGQPTPREVALTFDDGPTYDSNVQIVQTLEQTHTPATFFVLGQWVQRNPQLLQHEWNDGFAIGYHTWDHPSMPALSPSARYAELTSAIAIVHQVLGPRACVWLWRPPYGDVNSAVLQQAAGLGLTSVKWDDDSADWMTPGTQAIADRVLRNIHPGAIVLMHDGPRLRYQTAAALPLIIQGLRDRGLTPVTVPTLLADARGIVAPTATATPTETATTTP